MGNQSIYYWDKKRLLFGLIVIDNTKYYNRSTDPDILLDDSSTHTYVNWKHSTKVPPYQLWHKCAKCPMPILITTWSMYALYVPLVKSLRRPKFQAVLFYGQPLWSYRLFFLAVHWMIPKWPFNITRPNGHHICDPESQNSFCFTI